jgi:hypothetical protein
VGWAKFWAIFSTKSGHPDREEIKEIKDGLGYILGNFLGNFFYKIWSP